MCQKTKLGEEDIRTDKEGFSQKLRIDVVKKKAYLKNYA